MLGWVGLVGTSRILDNHNYDIDIIFVDVLKILFNANNSGRINRITIVEELPQIRKHCIQMKDDA